MCPVGTQGSGPLERVRHAGERIIHEIIDGTNLGPGFLSGTPGDNPIWFGMLTKLSGGCLWGQGAWLPLSRAVPTYGTTRLAHLVEK